MRNWNKEELTQQSHICHWPSQDADIMAEEDYKEIWLSFCNGGRCRYLWKRASRGRQGTRRRGCVVKVR
jgi:hypothetical protein